MLLPIKAMSHTTEIRERVLAYIEEGGLIKTACKLFGVSRSSLQRWRLRKAVVGLLLPWRLKVDYSHAAYLVSFFLKKFIILNSLNCILVR
ncbi:Transposase [Legionella santicrucis]|uniref:Transposase n=2 Tax=Legionella santicrucis TaxID=45074 RepID=A0A0W0YS93_9GAMM|nr:IS630 transposase-related protein [Legionella santicrucis]KTD59722.1 Transposase [Legionella santicrucis]